MVCGVRRHLPRYRRRRTVAPAAACQLVSWYTGAHFKRLYTGTGKTFVVSATRACCAATVNGHGGAIPTTTVSVAPALVAAAAAVIMTWQASPRA